MENQQPYFAVSVPDMQETLNFIQNLPVKVTNEKVYKIIKNLSESKVIHILPNPPKMEKVEDDVAEIVSETPVSEGEQNG